MPLSRSIVTLSSISPSPAPISLFGVVLGIDGPRPISLRAGGSTVLCTVHLADSSLPTGLELRLWGRDALSAASLRPMDVVHVGTVTACEDTKFARTLYLKFRHDSILTRVGEKDEEGEEVGKLFRWRDAEFGPLVRLARKGKLRSREWPKVSGRETTTAIREEKPGRKRREVEHVNAGEFVSLGEVGKLQPGTLATVLNVRVSGVRLRATLPGDDAMDALRGIVRRVCEACEATRSALKKGDEEGRCASCGGAPGGGWGWTFGEVFVVLRGREGKERAVAVASGVAVQRLLLGLKAEEAWEDGGARKGTRVLESLTRDDGPFRAVVRGGGDGDGVADVRLERLFVDHHP